MCVQGKPWVTTLELCGNRRIASTEISLLLKFGSSLQYNRKLVSYGTLWIAHKWVKISKNRLATFAP